MATKTVTTCMVCQKERMVCGGGQTERCTKPEKKKKAQIKYCRVPALIEKNLASSVPGNTFGEKKGDAESGGQPGGRKFYGEGKDGKAGRRIAKMLLTRHDQTRKASVYLQRV